MSEPPPGQPTAPEIRANLHQVAELLRHAHHLGPEAQDALADLVDELGATLDAKAVPFQEMAHLTASTAQLARALHERHDSGVLVAAKDRLEEAAVRAEAKAPMVTGVVRRVIDALANLGI
jgi:hypothetical protein